MSTWDDLVCVGDEARPSLRQAVEHLRAVYDRIQARETVEIDPASVSLVTSRAALAVWGDYVIDVGSGSTAGEFFDADCERFLRAELTPLLAAVERADCRPAGISPEALRRTLELARMLEADSLVPGENPEVWHAGWALLTLGWWVGESINMPVHINQYKMVTFEEARRFLRGYRETRNLECPRCTNDVEILLDEDRADLASILWHCASCDVAGYFPFRPHPESAWLELPEKREAAVAAAVASVWNVAGSDFSWMRDVSLRDVAGADFRELQVCTVAGALKATLLLAGSVTEAMLLDALERNTKITRTYFKRPDDFPEKASLEQLVTAARGEGLLTTTADVAPIMRAHRDLIHPNRMRAGNVVVDEHTVQVVDGLMRLIARDLRQAADTGRLDAFEKKT